MDLVRLLYALYASYLIKSDPKHPSLSYTEFQERLSQLLQLEGVLDT